MDGHPVEENPRIEKQCGCCFDFGKLSRRRETKGEALRRWINYNPIGDLIPCACVCCNTISPNLSGMIFKCVRIACVSGMYQLMLLFAFALFRMPLDPSNDAKSEIVWTSVVRMEIIVLYNTIVFSILLWILWLSEQQSRSGTISSCHNLILLVFVYDFLALCLLVQSSRSTYHLIYNPDYSLAIDEFNFFSGTFIFSGVMIVLSSTISLLFWCRAFCSGEMAASFVRQDKYAYDTQLFIHSVSGHLQSHDLDHVGYTVFGGTTQPPVVHLSDNAMGLKRQASTSARPRFSYSYSSSKRPYDTNRSDGNHFSYSVRPHQLLHQPQQQQQQQQHFIPRRKPERSELKRDIIDRQETERQEAALAETFQHDEIELQSVHSVPLGPDPTVRQRPMKITPPPDDSTSTVVHL